MSGEFSPHKINISARFVNKEKFQKIFEALAPRAYKKPCLPPHAFDTNFALFSSKIIN